MAGITPNPQLTADQVEALRQRQADRERAPRRSSEEIQAEMNQHLQRGMADPLILLQACDSMANPQLHYSPRNLVLVHQQVDQRNQNNPPAHEIAVTRFNEVSRWRDFSFDSRRIEILRGQEAVRIWERREKETFRRDDSGAFLRDSQNKLVPELDAAGKPKMFIVMEPRPVFDVSQTTARPLWERIRREPVLEPVLEPARLEKFSILLATGLQADTVPVPALKGGQREDMYDAFFRCTYGVARQKMNEDAARTFSNALAKGCNLRFSDSTRMPLAPAATANDINDLLNSMAKGSETFHHVAKHLNYHAILGVVQERAIWFKEIREVESARSHGHASEWKSSGRKETPASPQSLSQMSQQKQGRSQSL